MGSLPGRIRERTEVHSVPQKSCHGQGDSENPSGQLTCRCTSLPGRSQERRGHFQQKDARPAPDRNHIGAKRPCLQCQGLPVLSPSSVACPKQVPREVIFACLCEEPTGLGSFAALSTTCYWVGREWWSHWADRPSARRLELSGPE